MPWSVAKSDKCPSSKPWACIKDSDGTVEGCHATKDGAEAQMAALYASESEAKSMPVMTVARETAAEDRQAAAQARAAVAEQRGYYRSRPPTPVVVNVPCGSARSLAFPAQLRAKMEKRNGQELYHLNGVASVTDTPYEMWDEFGPYDEIMAREAFVGTLAAEPDVAFLVNHRGVTMARTTNGTLELSMAETGLNSDAWLNPKRQDVSDLVVAIDDRNIDQMSFAFMLEEGWWNDDFTTFKITKVDMNRGDVSAVNYGANPYTSIEARAREVMADLDHLPVGPARAAYERLGRRRDVIDLGQLRTTPSEPQSNGGTPTTPQSNGGSPQHSVAWYEARLAEE